ncbi:MAG: hypothetical protein ACREJM_16465, partial [Candidatus Saccharimonadales bacterium]
MGQGLFFAGQNHVHIQVVASPTETSLITTNPDQIRELQAADQAQQEGEFNQPQGSINLGPAAGGVPPPENGPGAGPAPVPGVPGAGNPA